MEEEEEETTFLTVDEAALELGLAEVEEEEEEEEEAPVELGLVDEAGFVPELIEETIFTAAGVAFSFAGGAVSSSSASVELRFLESVTGCSTTATFLSLASFFNSAAAAAAAVASAVTVWVSGDAVFASVAVRFLAARSEETSSPARSMFILIALGSEKYKQR